MTLDSASRARLNLVYPDLAVRIVRVINDMWESHGMQMRVTEGIRTWEYQAQLYAQGRTQPGRIVTWAKPGQSIHHYGAAVDCCFVGKDPYLEQFPPGHAEFFWKEYGRFCEAHGIVWGGFFLTKQGDSRADKPHAQITYGCSLEYIKELYKKNGLTAVWAEFDKIRGVPQGSEWLGPQTKVRMLELGQLVGETDSKGGING